MVNAESGSTASRMADAPPCPAKLSSREIGNTAPKFGDDEWSSSL
jgi:hypothetical protein